MTLVTCYPFDAIDPGGPLRYAVTAEALETEKTAATPVMAQALTSTASGGIETGEGLPNGPF
jgi:sortase A